MPGSTTKYTCDDVALSVVTSDFTLECVENKFYGVDEVRGVWLNKLAEVDPAEAILLDTNRNNIGCTVQECYEMHGDRYGFTNSLSWPYQIYNKPSLDSFSWAQAATASANPTSDYPDGSGTCQWNSQQATALCGLDLAETNYFARARWLQNPLHITYQKAAAQLQTS